MADASPDEEGMRDGFEKLAQMEEIAMYHAPNSGAELVAYWSGENLFAGRADIEGDSSEYARVLRKQARRREGINW